MDLTQEQWGRIKRKAELYFNGMNITDGKRMKGTFLYKCGDEMTTLFDGLPEIKETIPPGSTPKPDQEYTDLILTLDKYFNRPKNRHLEILRLRKMVREDNESLDAFVVRLRTQATKCDYKGDTLNEEMVLMIIIGGRNETLRDRILAEKDINLEKALEFGRILEEHKNTKEELNPSNVMRTNSLKRKFDDERRCFNCGLTGHMKSSKECPAMEQKCRHCEQIGHYKRCCPTLYKERKLAESRGNATATTKEKNEDSKDVKSKNWRIHAVQEDSEDEDMMGHCFMVGISDENKLMFQVGEINCKLFVDSGADVSLIKSSTWESLVNKGLKTIEVDWTCKKEVSGIAEGSTLKISHSFVAEVKLGAYMEKTKFFVASNASEDILGNETAKKLHCLAVGYKVNKVSESKEFRKVPDFKIKLHIDPKIRPKFKDIEDLDIPAMVERVKPQGNTQNLEVQMPSRAP